MHRHDERAARPERAAKRRAVQEVGPGRRAQARVPERVGREASAPATSPDTQLDELDVEMVAQPAHVPRRSGARLPKRRRIEGYAN